MNLPKLIKTFLSQNRLLSRPASNSKLWCAIFASSAAVVVSGCTPSFDELCTITFNNGASLTLPVARTENQLKQGLQGREDPSPGMIFIWPSIGVRAMWMQNTPAPLSAAWIDPNGSIQSIIDMEPETTEIHSSLKPAIAVIELPRGGFKALKLYEHASLVTQSSCF